MAATRIDEPIPRERGKPRIQFLTELLHHVTRSDGGDAIDPITRKRITGGRLLKDDELPSLMERVESDPDLEYDDLRTAVLFNKGNYTHTVYDLSERARNRQMERRRREAVKHR